MALRGEHGIFCRLIPDILRVHVDTELEGSFVAKQDACGFCFPSMHCLKL
jgi:hypothetical protein